MLSQTNHVAKTPKPQRAVWTSLFCHKNKFFGEDQQDNRPMQRDTSLNNRKNQAMTGQYYANKSRTMAVNHHYIKIDFK